MALEKNPPPPSLAQLASRLDRASGRHLYRQIAQLVRAAVASGSLRPGDAIPPQRELSRLWGVGEVTIRRALQELADEGLLEARAGSGTVVRDRRQARAADQPARPLTLGIAFADLTDGYPFFTPVLAGIRAAGRPVAVRLFDIPAEEQAAGSLSHAPPLAELDGLVMMSPANLGLLALCQSRRLPTVLLFNDIADGFSRCVVPDYAHGVAQAVRHLGRSGRRRIALVTAGEQRFSTGRWIDAYRAALQLHDLEFAGERVVHAGYSERAGAEAMRRLLRATPRPDAVLFASDHMARGGLLAAHEAGVAVPGEVAVIGAGPSLERGGWTVPLTTIDLGLEAMGRLAREAIEDARNNAPPAPLRQTVPARLVEGATA